MLAAGSGCEPSLAYRSPVGAGPVPEMTIVVEQSFDDTWSALMDLLTTSASQAPMPNGSRRIHIRARRSWIRRGPRLIDKPKMRLRVRQVLHQIAGLAIEGSAEPANDRPRPVALGK